MYLLGGINFACGDLFVIKSVISCRSLLLIARDGKTGEASRMNQQSRSTLVGLSAVCD